MVAQRWASQWGVVVVVVAVMGLFVGAVAARGQEYKVKVERPAKVGDSYAAVATAEVRRKMAFTVEGAKVPGVDKTFAVRLEGRNTVVAVDKRGRATKLSCAVAECVNDGKAVLEPGTVVTAERKGEETVYTVKGEAVAAEVAEVLNSVLRPDKADERGADDALISTDQPKRVGDAWPVNAEAGAAAITAKGFPVKKENVTGTCKLVAVKRVDGKEVLEIEVAYTVDQIAGPTHSGLVVESGKVSAAQTVLLPVDPAGGLAGTSESVQGLVTFKGKTPDGQAFVSQVELTVKSKVVQSDWKGGAGAP